VKSITLLAAVMALLSVVVGVTRPRPARDAGVWLGPLPGQDMIEAAIGTEPRRLGVSGGLTSIDETGMTVSTESGPVFVRFSGDTEFCREGCEVGWSALRPGDRISSGTTLGLGEERVADWVDANVTAGYGDVVAVDGAELSVVLSRPGQPGKQRVLVLQSYSRVEDNAGKALDAAKIRPGDSFYFTGSSETPDSARIWVYMIQGSSGS
jgi:hypothetical protein